MAEQDLTMTVLKWMFIVFAAGFVGYFGRYLSMQILAKIHKKKKDSKKPLSKAEIKLEKKRAKVEKKRLKALKKK
jgi:hypothetical protein